MSEELIWKLIEMIENASPHLWDIAMTQVQVLIYKDVALALFGLVLTPLCYGVFKRDWNDREFHLLAAIGLAAGICFILSPLFGDTLLRIANPEYYAIKVLLSLVGQ